MKKTIGLFMVLICAALAFQGCTAAPKAVETGFLQDYSGFGPGPEEGADKVYVKAGQDFTPYDKVMLDHVVFFFSDDAKYKGIHPDELQELSLAFHEAIVAELSGGYPIVEKPGPGVLRIRLAITDVVPSNPALNTMSTIIPIGLAISSIKKAATGVHANVGQASVEAELVDSITGERLAAAIDRRVGSKTQIVEGMDKWGHAKEAFAFWAGRLRRWLDDVHGRSQGN
jgi:hypothetical protein